MLIWTGAPREPRPGPSVWAWCPVCNGTGDHEYEGREGVQECEPCACCGGEGGFFEGPEAA
jgi:hypothetical protein